MIFHVTSIEENSNVVIRTADTDVLITALVSITQIPTYINLWLEVGLYSKNTLRYINVNKLYGKIGDQVCKSLQLTMLLQVATIPLLFLGEESPPP